MQMDCNVKSNDYSCLSARSISARLTLADHRSAEGLRRRNIEREIIPCRVDHDAVIASGSLHRSVRTCAACVCGAPASARRHPGAVSSPSVVGASVDASVWARWRPLRSTTMTTTFPVERKRAIIWWIYGRNPSVATWGTTGEAGEGAALCAPSRRGGPRPPPTGECHDSWGYRIRPSCRYLQPISCTAMHTLGALTAASGVGAIKGLRGVATTRKVCHHVCVRQER